MKIVHYEKFDTIPYPYEPDTRYNYLVSKIVTFGQTYDFEAYLSVNGV